MIQTHQTPLIRPQDQAQACEAIARHHGTLLAALRKAGVQEAQARAILEGVAAAGRTLRELAAEGRG